MSEETKLKSIVVDGKTYICEDIVNSEYTKKSELDKEFKKPRMSDSIFNLRDEACVMAIGSSTLSGEWQTVLISTTYLKRALAIVENMTGFEKGKRIEAIMLSFAKDMPLCLGAVDEKSGKFSGVVIAPRVQHD